ncbi:MAG: AMP-binding protein, partial [bacterium]|nr:AMP-binding protein [bacterium]
GYLNRPQLTNSKFQITNKTPASSAPSAPSAVKIYRTGDLARWLPDGNIEFLGRFDHQVKIQGVRIELGEIETRLSSHEYVREAVVMAKENPGGEKYLCAYYIPAEGDYVPAKGDYIPGDGIGDGDPVFFPESEPGNFLITELPDYMVPSCFIALREFPLKPNGKINRDALPEPDFSPAPVYVPPANETEKIVLDIWTELLDREKETIGVYDDFFRLGGHSLNASIAVSRIHKRLNVKVPLMKVFTLKNIRGLSG